MKSVKTSGDEPEAREAIASRQQESEGTFSGGALSTTSGDALAGDRETTYLERKALAAAGQWGRVKAVDGGCLEWLGAKNNKGYGVVGVGKRIFYAHRLVCEIFNGPLLKNQDACHSCNNPSCINPRHLAPGTRMDNMHDREEYHGRGRPAAVTPESMQEAIRLYSGGGWSLAQLGAKYGVTGSAMGVRLKGISRPEGRRRGRTRAVWAHQEAIALYQGGGWTIAKLAEKFSVSTGVVVLAMKGVARPDRKQGSGRKPRG